MVMDVEYNKEGERNLEFCSAMNMTIGYALFKQRTGNLVTYESSTSNTQVDHFQVRRDQRKFVKDIPLSYIVKTL